MSKTITQLGALILAVFCLLIVASPQAAAVQPSGYGQTTKANSLSVAIASDQTVPVSGTITATVDTSTLATSAKQDTGNTSLGSIKSNTDTLVTNTTSIATAAAQATQLTALNLLTQPKSTTTVTKSDATDTTTFCGKGLWVGTAGDVAVKFLSDSSATTLKNVPSGTFVPGQFLRVMSTNTTASDMVCFGGTG